MKQYKLKQGVPELVIMDGPRQGEIFLHGKIYNAIPERYDTSFVLLKSRTVKREFGKKKSSTLAQKLKKGDA